jgi:hypothetical protein
MRVPATRGDSARGGLCSRTISLPDIRAGDHLVALYSRSAERDDLLYLYLRDGLDRDHSCTACLSGGASLPVLDRLSGDVDVAAKRSSGQLGICHWPRVEEPSGAKAACTLWNQVISRRPGGFDCARVSVEANSCLPGLGDHELLRFESQLATLASGGPVAFMFMYDVTDLDGALVVELARTHAVLWTSGGALLNPYCTMN